MYLISYDISDNKIRTKIGHKLIYFGLSRIQYSVFVGPLSETLYPHLLNWLKSIEGNLEKGNSILILSLTPANVQRKVILGDTALNWQEIIGLSNTLYIS